MSVDAGTLARLNILVGMDDSAAARSMVGLQQRTQTLSQNLGRIGGKMMKTITLPAIAMAGVMVKMADSVQKGVAQLRLQTGATGKDLEALSESYRKVLATATQTGEEVGSAMGFIQTRTGLTGPPLEKLTTQILQLARISGGDLNTMVNTSTRMFGDWSIATENQAGALDQVWKASQNSGISMDRLMSLIVQYGAPLRQLGFSFDQATAMLAKFDAEGVNTELVMGSLRIALGKMAQEGVKDPAQALSILIRRIKEAGTTGQANAIALDAFGARAGPDMAAAIREGRLDLDAFLKKMADSKETIGAAAAESETLGDKLARLKNKILLALEPLGRQLLVKFEQFIPTIEEGFVKVGQWIEQWDELPASTRKIILWSAGILLAAGPVLSFVSLLAGGFALLTTTILGVPLWIIAAIAGGVYLIVTNWDKAVQAVKDYWAELKALWNWQANREGLGGGFAPGGGEGAGGGGARVGGTAAEAGEVPPGTPAAEPLPDWAAEMIARMDADAAATKTEPDMRVHHDGTIRIEGVNGQGELIAVADLLAEQMRVDQDRYAAVPSERRFFK